MSPPRLAPTRQQGLIVLLTALCVGSGGATACAAVESESSLEATPSRTRVWFAPNEGSVDLLRLFTHPNEWASAREQVDVFKFYTGQIATTRQSCRGSVRCGSNYIDNLAHAKAFERLKEWGIEIAIESLYPEPRTYLGTSKCARGPKIVELATAVATELIHSVESNGGTVRYLAMDEPVRKWYPEAIHFARNVPVTRPCLVGTLTELADDVASHVRQIEAAHPGVRVGQVELYPEVGVAQLKEWITELEKRDIKLPFLHLDVHGHRIDTYRARGVPLDVAKDLKELKAFLEQRKIAFGVIFTDIRWQQRLGSGYDDETYYEQTMEWVRFVHSAIGAPSDAIFQSWVPTPDRKGQKRMPNNLPEQGDSVYSHTQLIREGMTALEKP